ncbi:MAG: hypothetical protein COT81_00835 [Candidatus Buchananbacteria bacterium CG10_big_fil_rev_8_21_14_0_10_42_9]|uniref:Glycosyltransferase RgtA/B/C/D-like domain-containing protein n=1 Tax=Candidatus Buchananbacteria bacterium CG10_big_fil_rev_8_21_14_0_10_42_9 TaxID=1974526 RepID=A0A2H0W2H6_9BACT|nr:MAG: hypothetical protein COT81_00835 [Candidatus Buchananbacteria bacterium CG10_big_fil_rev_8_21_14_0_10_42_9]
MRALKFDNNLVYIILLSLLALIVYLIFPFRQVQLAEGGRVIFNSPDETANFVFANQFAKFGELQLAPKAEYHVPEIHPRSVTVISGNYVPTSFIGMPVLFGGIAKLAGIKSIIFLTPILSAITLVFFYLLLRKIFSEPIAIVSTIMLAALPPYVYYTARSMFHNVLFLDLLIISLYFLVSYIKELKLISLFFGVLLLAASIVIRPSEVLWVLPLFLALLFVFKSRVRVNLAIFLFAVLGFLVYMPVFYYQTSLYEIPVATGYPGDPIAEAVEASHDGGITATALAFINQSIFPFGIHPKRAALTFYHYFVDFFWWLAIPVILGSWWFVRKQENAAPRVYFHAWIWPSLFLILFYGSWIIKDTVSPSLYTIGTSYVRYLLPVYVFSIPIAAFVLIKASQVIPYRRIGTTLVISFIMIYLTFSTIVTFTGGNESLISVDDAVGAFYTKAKLTRSVVEPSAVIVAEKTDKIFWPEYDVMSSIFDDATRSSLRDIATKRPVYYYTFLNQADLAEVNSRLASSTVQLVDPINIFENENIYKIVPLES